MELASSLLERLGPQIGVDALPTWRAPGQIAEGGPDPARDYPFILNAGSRLPMFVHSRTYRLSWTRGLRPRPAADLNPADARALGIAQDEWIELRTPAGAIRVLANLTELAQPGVVHMYHGHPEADVNLLLDPDDLDPISGFPAYRSVPCRIDKARPGGDVVSDAFYLDVDRCTGCYACAVACMDQNDLDTAEGATAWRTVFTVESGAYPEASLRYVSLACMHCEDAPCVLACPTTALRRSGEPPVVRVDGGLCIGCHGCAMACPYGVPRFGTDEQGMTEAVERRLRQLRSRVLVRAWDYRQRNHARGVWFRLRRVLAEASQAYAVSTAEAQELLAEGHRPEPVGEELSPSRPILFVSAERALRLASARPLAVRLSAELLAAESLVLIPFSRQP